MPKWEFSAIFSRLVHRIDLILHILNALNGFRDLAVVSLIFCIISILYAKIGVFFLVNIITFTHLSLGCLVASLFSFLLSASPTSSMLVGIGIYGFSVDWFIVYATW